MISEIFSPTRSYLQIHPMDNVLVALREMKKGEQVVWNGQKIYLQEDIPAKHKFPIHLLEQEEEVYMYGTLIGKATETVPAGSLLSSRNLIHAALQYDVKPSSFLWEAPDVSKWKHRTFDGYHRSDGQVGIRNFWLVIPLVFCENRNILTLKNAFLKELGYEQPDRYRQTVQKLIDSYEHGASLDEIEQLSLDELSRHTRSKRFFPNVDGIKFLTHESGCGGTREDSQNLCNLLAGYCVHPNVGGITVLSLGCQHAQVDLLQAAILERDPAFSKKLLIYERQDWKTEHEMLNEAIRHTFLGMAQINQLERAPAPLHHLSLGVKCGGSDGFSGISANPAMGHAADLLVALGGKVIMAEFPELCGVEQELINRCKDEETATRFATLMKEYALRAKAVGSGFDMNPSPGNIRDGLITDAMKSAGAAKKGGSSPVTDVLGYGKYAIRAGLNLLCTPGNDVESTSGIAGAGATVQLFSTGLGTPTGNPVSPIVKISSNTSLASRLPDLIDLDAGSIIRGEQSVEEVGEQILEYILGLASGDYDTCAMLLGQDDFIFWKRGVSL